MRQVLTRRSLGRAAALAGAVGAFVPSSLVRASAPAPNTGHITLVLRPYYGGFYKELAPLYQQVLSGFLSKHPSVRITLSQFPRGDQSGLVSAMLAGDAPDIMENYVSTDLVSGGYLLNLMPYVKSSNADLSQLPAGQVQYFTHGDALYALPITPEWICAAVNLSMFDRLGLKYPSPNWDYREAETLYRQLAKPSSNPNKAVYGGQFVQYFGQQPDTMYLDMWGGAVLDPTNPAVCTLDSKACVDCSTYFAGLVQDNAVVLAGPGDSRYFNQQIAIGLASDWTMVTYAQKIGQNAFKMDFWPLPAGPVRSATFGSQAYYGVSATTKYPEAAWELLQWMTWVPDFQRMVMRTSLLVPPLSSMAPEYLQTLRTVAPPLRRVNLEACIEIANRPVNPAFAYNDSAAENLISNAYQQVWQKKATPAQALQTVTRQVNALESAFAVSAAQQKKAQAAVVGALAKAQSSTASVTLPAAPAHGVGAQAVPAPAHALTSTPTGTYTLLGGGSGLSGAADGLTFACLPWNASRGTLTCRLVSVAAVGLPSLPDGAKIGLMARGDLSTEAMNISVEVAIGRGVHVASRAIEALSMSDQRQGETPGLLSASGLLQTPSKAGGNYLVRPVWLRLVRNVALWSALTSLDGNTWQPAGRVMGLQVSGVWAGLFVTTHDSNPAHRVRAAFDHVSFAPTATYQIG